MSLPDLNREVAIMAESFSEALMVSKEDITALWDQALERWGEGGIRTLHANTPRELAVEVYRNRDGLLTLWLGESRLARLQR